MGFVLSGENLETLICHSCQRFLSVSPVKVYPNKYIKCGRCSQDNDQGVISFYQLVAERSLFKCVNRFDGCRTLLTCSQVVEHEAKCITREYVCPICENFEVPTFMIPEHFEELHQPVILRYPYFSVDLEISSDVNEKIFFYRLKDDLFMILFRLNPADEVIFLNTFHFGERSRAVKIEQRFSVQFIGSNITIDTDKKFCTPYSKEGLKDRGNTEGFVIEFSNMFMEIHVDVELKLNVAEIIGNFTGPTLDQKESKPVEISPTSSTKTDVINQSSKSTDTVDLSNTNLNECDSLRHFRKLSDICFQKKLTLPRRVFLDNSFMKNYPEYSTDLDFYNMITTSLSGKIEIILSCYFCHELCFDQDSYIKSVFFRQNQSYIWICSPCYIVFKNSEEYKFTYPQARLVFDYYVYSYIMFLCYWGCNTASYNTHLFKHEISCVNQPLQACPVAQCAHSGKLFDIEKHFSEKHVGTQFVSLQSTFMTKLNRNDKYEFQWYVWTPPSFVMVKFCWNMGNYSWCVTMGMCQADSKVQPTVYLFDNDWKILKVLKTNETSQEEQYITETENLRIKCFVEPK